MACFPSRSISRLVQWLDELAFAVLGLVAAQLDRLFHIRNTVAQRLFLGRAGPVSGPIVRFIRAYYGARIRILAAEFEPEFYVSQIPDAFGRASASGDPILHYMMLGHFVGLSPNRAFEPRHYREQHPKLSIFAPPFLDFLRRGRPAGEAPNHLAGRSSRKAAGPERAVALVIDHPRGGGSTRYLNIYEDRLRAEGFSVIRGRRVGGGLPLMVFGEEPDAAWFNPFAEEDRLSQFVRAAGVDHLVINHMVDLPGVSLDWAKTISERLGLSYEVILHDYYMICPRITLVDAQGRYCGVGDQAACAACLGARGREFAGVDIAAWRATAEALLAGAARVVAPSEDLASRIRQTLPTIEVEVFEPELTLTMPQRPHRPLRPGERLHVTMLGALDEPKGYAVIAELAKWIRATGAPIQLQVIGDTKGTRQLRRLGVTVTGRYIQADLEVILDRLAPHIFFFPAIWPETWSFTLTAALARGTPVAAFDIGAIAQRLRRAGAGALLPYEMHGDIARLGEWFTRLRQEMSIHQTDEAVARLAKVTEAAPRIGGCPVAS